MNGLDKILERITSDCDAYCKRVTDEAETQSDDIIAEAEDAARRTLAAARKKAEAEATAIVERAKSSSVLAERNAVLAMKSSLIDDAFKRAAQLLIDSPKDYRAFLSAQLESAISDAPDAQYTMSVRESDRKICAEIINSRPNITIDKSGAKIDSGFILRCGDIDSDCTVSTSAEALRDALTGEVAAVLFK